MPDLHNGAPAPVQDQIDAAFAELENTCSEPARNNGDVVEERADADVESIIGELELLNELEAADAGELVIEPLNESELDAVEASVADAERSKIEPATTPTPAQPPQVRDRHSELARNLIDKFQQIRTKHAAARMAPKPVSVPHPTPVSVPPSEIKPAVETAQNKLDHLINRERALKMAFEIELRAIRAELQAARRERDAAILRERERSKPPEPVAAKPTTTIEWVRQAMKKYARPQVDPETKRANKAAKEKRRLARVAADTDRLAQARETKRQKQQRWRMRKKGLDA